jgi:catechol 2,3-dioxygenase-like lactoylglutathione lyase family enzyme
MKMQIGQLDHVNVRTANVEAMVEWYKDNLGMEEGPRPPFPFPGAWLYADGKAVVHLVGVEEEQKSIEPKIEHFALRASGLAAFLERLDAANVTYEIARVPGFGILQVNVNDVDGNHIHIDFTPEEADALGL